MNLRSVEIEVVRYKQGDPQPYTERFTVPTNVRTTVLDALLIIRRDFDPSLTVRHSCLHASCGTCAMKVNGKEVLSCVTNVWELRTSVVHVSPLDHLPVLSDVVVDMQYFFEKFNRIDRPLIQTNELLPAATPAEGIDKPTRYEDCIECGACVSACPIAGTDPFYLGPATLAAAGRVISEPRGRDTAHILSIVDTEHGCWRCHTAFECSEVCPSNVDPANHIMKLRKRLIKQRFGICETVT